MTRPNQTSLFRNQYHKKSGLFWQNDANYPRINPKIYRPKIYRMYH